VAEGGGEGFGGAVTEVDAAGEGEPSTDDVWSGPEDGDAAVAAAVGSTGLRDCTHTTEPITATAATIQGRRAARGTSPGGAVLATLIPGGVSAGACATVGSTRAMAGRDRWT